MRCLNEELTKLISDNNNMAGFVPFLYSIGTHYKKKLRTIVEIGVRGGVSTNAFLLGIRDRGHKNARLFSIDIADCSGVVQDESLKNNWTFIQNDSKTLDWNREIDILLIDGDHSYDGVKADYEKYEPFVKDGGLILLHDVLWEKKGVPKFFWEEIGYPSSVLSLSPSGLGIVYKKKAPFYDADKFKDNIL